MAFIISGSTIQSQGKIDIPDCYCIPSIQMLQNPNDNFKISVDLAFYKSESDFNGGSAAIPVENIPNQILYIRNYDITGTQYANLNNNTIHNALKGFLESGSSAPNYPVNAPAWAGIGTGTTTIDLPS